jgi:ligand-binding sensor domain-containing protein/DNA-binding CsgD family transcriptional regulator
MKKYHLNILVFLLLCFSQYGHAFRPEIRNFSKKAYKAGAQNWEVVQGGSGSMYFANSEGVLEYDGAHWWLYRVPNLTDVRSLYYDAPSNRLLAGASDEAGSYSVTGGGFNYTSLLDSLPLPALGEIWRIRTLGSVVTLQENQHIRLLSGADSRSFSFSGKIDCMERFGDRLYFSVRGDGVYALSAESKPEMLCSLPKGANVRAMLAYGGKTLLVTESQGVLLLDGASIGPSDIPVLSDNVFCAAISGDLLALGTVAEGLYLYNIKDGATMHLDADDGLQRNTILSMAFDHGGNLWLGLNNGIDQILLSESVWDMFGGEDRYGAGYASARFGDKLYLGTNQGLFFMDYSGDEAQLDNPLQAVRDIRWQVWSLDVIGNALICSHDKGLRIFYDNGKQDDIPLNGSWRVESLAAHPGYLLGSTYDRMYVLRYEKGRFHFAGYPEGFEDASKSYAEAPDGRIWFGHWVKGLFRLSFSPDMGRVEKVESFSEADGFPTARNIYPNHYRGGIVFSTEGGFYKYDNEAGKAVPMDELNGLFAGTPLVVMLTEGPLGQRFFSSGSVQGLERAGVLDTLSLRRLGRRRILGFYSNTFLADNLLMVNTEDGFSLIRTNSVEQTSGEGFPVYIREAVLIEGGKESTLLETRTPSHGAEIRLGPGSHSVRFVFVCPEFSSDEAVEYRCRLDGLDREWTGFRADNSREYTKLPPGNYTFMVEARNAGTGEISADSVVLRIAAPWYQSIWMYGIYALLLVGALWGLSRFIRFQSDRRARKLTRQREAEMEKARMVNDMQKQADDLAASTMNVIRKNQMLQSIDMELYKLDGADSEQRRILLRRLHREIGENIEHDDDWQKFSQHFDFVYDNYLKRLGRQYPALTTGDKKLCAYLKMDLSSKEIAPLMNMTIRSVEMTRHRLRKKLGLSREDNLSDFLQRF